MTGDDATASPWEQWPETLRERGRRVLAELGAGRPQAAVDILDELLADVLARRDTLADSANRTFEPSTDDRSH
ncbi:hypothetical protein ACFS2C_15580 [Prauserella oleivorans]|uniref:Uncharacterized protein n=1 Tax=Prauserella oleivorans TaxID=1478153 RepID=A0ABW5WE21_9PSEU